MIRSIYESFQRDLHGLAQNEIHEIFLNNINQLIQQLTQEQGMANGELEQYTGTL